MAALQDSCVVACVFLPRVDRAGVAGHAVRAPSDPAVRGGGCGAWARGGPFPFALRGPRRGPCGDKVRSAPRGLSDGHTDGQGRGQEERGDTGPAVRPPAPGADALTECLHSQAPAVP